MSRGRGASGFTLIEIAVALGILGIGLVACMQIFSGSLKLEDRSSREARAALYARAIMDEMLVRPAERLRNGEESLEPTAEGFRARRAIRDAGPAEGVEKRELDFEAETALRYLEVEVGWQDGQHAKTYVVRSMRMAPHDE